MGIGQLTGNTNDAGSGRILINFGSVQTDVVVASTKNNAQDSGLEPVRLIGSHASNEIHVSGRSFVGLGTTNGDESPTWTVIDAAETQTSGGAGTPTVNVGRGRH